MTTPVSDLAAMMIHIMTYEEKWEVSDKLLIQPTKKAAIYKNIQRLSFSWGIDLSLAACMFSHDFNLFIYIPMNYFRYIIPPLGIQNI